MKRFWVAITIASLLLLSPILSQGTTGGETKKETTTETKPAATDKKEVTKKTESTEKKAEKKPAGEQKAVIWTDKNGTKFANSRVRFTLVASDKLSDVDYIEYRVDDGKFGKYSGAFSLQEEGPHTIIYRAVDKAGNREVDQVFTVVIDNKAPDIRVLPAKPFHVKGGRNYTSSGNFFTIRVTDQFSGVKSVVYSVNSNELKPYKGEIIKLETAGTQFVKYQAVDNLGNRTVNGNMVINVDSEKPTVSIVTTSPLFKVGEKQYARRNTGFVVKGTDTGSGIARIMVRLDGATEWQTYSDTLFFDQEKEHKIEAKAIDSVGNESDVQTITFVLDDNPPKTKIEPVVN